MAYYKFTGNATTNYPLLGINATPGSVYDLDPNVIAGLDSNWVATSGPTTVVSNPTVLGVGQQIGDLSATYVPRATKTQADPGVASDVDLILTGVNRSAANGSSGVIRAEAQALSILLNNNTGTDLSLTHAYEAVQFTVPAGVNQFGAVVVRLKQTGAPNTATVTCNIYSDNAGLPGTVQTLNNGPTTVYGKDIGSSYSTFQFLVRINSASPTNYWAVFTIAGLSSGTISMDTAATGNGGYANSANGTAWTAGSSKPYLELRGQTPAALQGTSENYVGVRGDSTDYYGLYGNTVGGIGVHGGSTSGYGVEGISVDNDGMHGISQGAGYGAYGSSTNGVGVYGTGGQGGVRGDSTTGFGGVLGTNNQSNGPGVWGDNTSTGDGVYGRSVPGTGYGVHSEGFFAVTSGYPPVGAAGANAGAAAPAPSLPWPGCQNSKGSLTFGTGTAPSAGAQVNVTFGKTAPAVPTVIICPANAATAALQPYVSGVTANGFTISFAVAPAASQANTVYAVNYFVVG